MAEGSTSSKGFAKVFSKSIGRTKEKVIQKLGKVDKTTDDALDEHVANFHKQQATAAKLQKELKNYIVCVKAMSTASKSFYDTVKETYEQEWTGYTELFSAVEHLSILWDDYIRKLSDDIQTPLATYIQRFPDTRTKISKRGRKLIDYDSTRHNLDTVQGAKKRDEGKISKAQEEMETARKIYEEFNNDLHDELPALYESRRNFYSTNFHALFTAECKFQEECAKLKNTLADRLGKECDNQGEIFLTKKPSSASQRSNASNDDSETNAVHLGDEEPGQGLTKFYNVAIPNDVNNDKTSDTERKSSPRGSKTDSDVEIEVTHENHKETINFPLRNGDVSNEGKGKRKSQEETYEPVTVGAQDIQVAVKAIPSSNQTVKLAEKPPAAVEAKVVIRDKKTCRPRKSYTSWDILKEEQLLFVAASVQDAFQQNVIHINEQARAESDDEEEYEEDDSDMKVMGDKRSSSNSNPDKNKPAEMVYSMATETEDIYKVPTSNEPVENMGDNVLYKVKATHAYAGEDVDELTFDTGDVIRVIPFDDPEDQDEGWLMGISESTKEKGVFPANFTKKLNVSLD